MSPEEFFMYLTIALIVLIPISARLYRYFTMRQVTRMLRQQLNQTAEQSKTNDRVR